MAALHSFVDGLLSTYYIPGTMLDACKQQTNPCLHEAHTRTVRKTLTRCFIFISIIPILQRHELDGVQNG